MLSPQLLPINLETLRLAEHAYGRRGWSAD
jgi:hypothetical protein